MKLFLSGEVVETGLNLAPNFSDFESLLAQKPWNDRLCSFSAQLRHRTSNCAWLLRPPRMKVIPSDDQSRLFCHFAYEEVWLRRNSSHCPLLPERPSVYLYAHLPEFGPVQHVIYGLDVLKTLLETPLAHYPKERHMETELPGRTLGAIYGFNDQLKEDFQVLYNASRYLKFGWNPRRPERFSWGRMRDIWLGWWSFEVACMAPVPTLQVCEITHMYSPRDP